jgi:hypothetical protein
MGCRLFERPRCAPLPELTASLRNSEEAREAIRFELLTARHTIAELTADSMSLPAILQRASEHTKHLAENLDAMLQADERDPVSWHYLSRLSGILCAVISMNDGLPSHVLCLQLCTGENGCGRRHTTTAASSVRRRPGRVGGV